MTQCVVYWMHLKDHKDITNEGYIGITIKFKRRMAAHHRESKVKYKGYTIQNAILKYGWPSIKRDIVFTGSVGECRSKEKELRPTSNIGWNMAVGGQEQPICSGYWQGKTLSEEHKQKMRDAERSLRGPKTREERIVEVLAQYEQVKLEALSKNLSRTFLIIRPDDIVDYCENLSEYCRNNNIRQNCMSQCASGLRQQHKGYYCIRLTP